MSRRFIKDVIREFVGTFDLLITLTVILMALAFGPKIGALLLLVILGLSIFEVREDRKYE